MSYTELYKFNKTGDASFIGETHNAFRGAAAIWGILENKYLPPYFFHGLEKCSRLSSGDMTEIQKIWDLINDPKVTERDKIVLGATFDDVIVMRKDIDDLLLAFDEFEGDTSLKEQAKIIKTEIKKTPDLIAIAWNQTSVNGDNWLNYGGYDDDDEAIPYNIIKMSDRHWDLFEELKKTA